MAKINKKLDTKFRTKVTMTLANVVCKIWWYGRCKLRRDVNDFDYHITDLRKTYPNEIVYQADMGNLPFITKTLIEDSKTERSSALKIGDCNIAYTFNKLMKAEDIAEHNVIGLYGDPRLEQIEALITSTKIRHNNPSKFSKSITREGISNVVKFTNK
jgi:hypothetical protein|tara:strand:+ start:242 stop:715 length:474 start_codon:yes stop_codon:yes gene_type:complete